jgi:hypothetical protein
MYLCIGRAQNSVTQCPGLTPDLLSELSDLPETPFPYTFIKVSPQQCPTHIEPVAHHKANT